MQARRVHHRPIVPGARGRVLQRSAVEVVTNGRDMPIAGFHTVNERSQEAASYLGAIEQVLPSDSFVAPEAISSADAMHVDAPEKIEAGISAVHVGLAAVCAASVVLAFTFLRFL